MSSVTGSPAPGASPDPRAPADTAPYPSSGYAWYVVAVLLLAYVLSFVDRELLGLLAESIKRDLQLSDTRLSWLMGPAFAVFYTLFGIPIAWLADRSNRRGIISAGIFVWSWMTAFCGLASNYWQLFLARTGVGIGEAALSPPALSLLRDYFPKERIGRAIGVYTMGVSVGSGVANIINAALFPMIIAQGAVSVAFVGTLQPWQLLFVIVGLPGVLVALLVLTIREPARRQRAPATGTSFWHTLRFVWARGRCYGFMFVGFSAMTVVAYGIGYWIPSFFVRTYGVSPQELSEILIQRGVILMVCGVIGVFGGGYLCDVLARRYPDAPLRVSLGAFVLLGIGFVAFPLMPTAQLALWCFVPATLGAAAPTAAGATALVTIAPPHMRAQITAMYYFVLSIIGAGLGPMFVALFTDYYFQNEADLRYSLALTAFVACAGGGVLLYYALRPFRRAAEEARAWS
ncbi:MAG: MFS transporter [Gammaproteobacteria bacterium]|nr:MFS transporter [Gammaproteobacteria bacterium]